MIFVGFFVVVVACVVFSQFSCFGGFVICRACNCVCAVVCASLLVHFSSCVMFRGHSVVVCCFI